MTKEEVFRMLEEVDDPEYPISVVDLGLIRDVEIEGGHVTVIMTFTSTGCGCMDWMVEDIKERLLREEGIDEVEVKFDWSRPWTADDLTEKGREVMQSLYVDTGLKVAKKGVGQSEREVV